MNFSFEETYQSKTNSPVNEFIDSFERNQNALKNLGIDCNFDSVSVNYDFKSCQYHIIVENYPVNMDATEVKELIKNQLLN